MYLKTLTLRGFKSFASATTLELEPGVTCVVGPNGSGKSNVVDALAWVMGEQGAKSLRGAAMEDVIFAGTSGRPPLGRAQVTLTIDNADGALPIDFTEVTISRTMFRQGGSEYAINGSPCRLLDVQELLSDSGLGRQMHVIVGQGQLDAVLRATPEERRGFIEEAAGVLKHRRRKEKALRKLESMQANLVRLQDLIAEIRRQLGPLARQAQVARKAAVVQADLRDAKARLLADDLVQLLASAARGAADEAAIKAQQAEVEVRLEQLTTTAAELETALHRVSPALDEASEVWYRLSSLRERLRGLHALATERTRLLAAAPAAPVGQDPDELEAQAERTRAAERELAAETELASKALEAALATRSAAEEAAQRASAEWNQLQRAVSDRREGLARLTAQTEAARERQAAAETELARLHAELAAATERASHAQVQFSALEMEVADGEAGELDLDAAATAARAELDSATDVADNLRQRHAAISQDVATLGATIAALQLSIDSTDGAGALLTAQDGPRVDGNLAAALTVSPGYEAAAAAVLGPVAEALIVPDQAAAAAAVAWLRETEGGRAGLIIADGSGSGSGSGSDTGRAAGQPTANGSHAGGPAAPPAGSQWLAQHVSATQAAAAAMTALLADVVVVDDLGAAMDIVAANPRLTAVTRQGDIASAALVIGGSTAGPSVLHVQAALDEAQTARDSAMADLAEVEAALPAANARLAAAQAAHDHAHARISESDAAMAAVANRLGRLAEVVKASQAEHERIAQRLQAAQAEAEQRAVALADVEQRLAAAQMSPDEADGALEGAAARRAEADHSATAARAAETEARLALRTSEERGRALAGRVQGLERAAARERAARRDAQLAQQRRVEQTRRANGVIAGVAVALTALEASLAQATAEREAAQRQRADIDQRLAAARAAVEPARAQLAAFKDAAHRDELARTQLRLRVEQLHERAMEELGIDPDTLVNEYGPDQPIVQVVAEDAAGDAGTGAADGADTGAAPATIAYVRAEQEKRLRAAERAMSVLGKVNPLALEEFAALEERHQFLAEQLDDLKRSRADLLGIVKEIDERVERVFTEAYADTAAQFEVIFPRLFPGGEGRLVLTDPSDMLTTGVEVEARPAGKKVKRLSLLSGGERSLTAIALLVSIFKARPSPFYVMDEVEAALDDVNLGRLLGIFTELRQSSQLIVITHQKRTMEIADALYGVTMQGDGVTTVISQRLREDA